MSTTQTTHGGRRIGAGRPIGTTRPHRTEIVAVRMTPAERTAAEAIGQGNASEGLRLALAAYKAP